MIVSRVSSCCPCSRPTKFDAHYRVPSDESIEQMLVELQVVQPATPPTQIQGLVQQFRTEFIERNPTTPNPKKLRKLLEKSARARSKRR